MLAGIRLAWTLWRHRDEIEFLGQADSGKWLIRFRGQEIPLRQTEYERFRRLS